MKKIIFIVFCLLSAAFAKAEPPPEPMNFATMTEFHVVTDQVRIYSDNQIYAQTHLPTPCLGNCVEGTWYRVNLSRWGVPIDAKAAFFGGMLLITHGTIVETADIHATFKRPGDTTATCDKYFGQTTEAHVGGGQRSNLATWIPLENASFDWCYTTTTSGNWPANSSYGVNMTLQMWGR